MSLHPIAPLALHSLYAQILKLISYLCISNGFALLHQHGLLQLSVDSRALHVSF
jgi:hypothetical protein